MGFLPPGLEQEASATAKGDDLFGSGYIYRITAPRASVVPIYTGDITTPHMDEGRVTVKLMEQDGIIKLIDKPAIPIEELMNHISGPDFPTGGIICGNQGIKNAYQTGKGLITVRARINTGETKSGKKSL